MEKSKGILKYWILHKIMDLFRFMEMFIFFVMISRFSSQLPPAVNVSADYFRGISFSPKFVFVIGNLIVLILLFISRVDENGDCIGNTDLCYEYVKSVTNYTTVNCTGSPANVTVAISKRKMCRSKSENPMKTNCRESQIHRELRRSETEVSRSKKYGDGDAPAVVVGDKLSCEEFRRTVEAFIARRQKLLRDEEFSPMVYIGS